ncbi:MAG: hypothetical protein CR988_04810 [Treponema sp.]|nr:MAG: hypothetical protein CR988_04810 [Treponema sp.]
MFFLCQVLPLAKLAVLNCKYITTLYKTCGVIFLELHRRKKSAVIYGKYYRKPACNAKALICFLRA